MKGDPEINNVGPEQHFHSLNMTGKWGVPVQSKINLRIPKYICFRKHNGVPKILTRCPENFLFKIF